MSEKTEWAEKRCQDCWGDEFRLEKKETDRGIKVIGIICRQCDKKEIIYCG